MRLHNAKPLCALRGTMAEHTSAKQSLRGTMILSLCVFFSIGFCLEYNTVAVSENLSDCLPAVARQSLRLNDLKKQSET